jgi:hypothetical protein
MASDNRDGAYTQWREDLHPRQPAGTSQGGEFAPKAGSSREQWLASLTREEKLAMQAWGNSAVSVRESPQHLSAFRSALQRAPKFQGTVYRGSDIAQTKEGVQDRLTALLQPNATITLDREWSFSKEREGSRGFTGEVLYIADQRSARDVRGAFTVTQGGKFITEEEVIAVTGTKYRVTGVTYENRYGQPFGKVTGSVVPVNASDELEDRPHRIWGRGGHYVVRLQEL